MSDNLSTSEIIPSDYSCRLIFRRFKNTLIHTYSHLMFNGGTFMLSDDIGTSGMHYCGKNACLEYFLRLGWPHRTQGANWNHSGKIVEVFIDDLHLCPKCGTFRLIELASNSLESIGIDFRAKFVDLRGGHEIWKPANECVTQIRTFCESRLKTNEFSYKECDDAKLCEEVRRIALSRLRREYGYGSKRKKARLLFPDPIVEIKTERALKKLPWDEGFVYLVRSGGFYKIGLAKDTHKRISGLKTSSPFEIEMLKSWQCKRPNEIERILHNRFSEHRVRGEWFQLPEDILKFLLAVEDLRKEFVPEK